MATKTSSFEKLFHLIRLERSEISAIYFYAILNGLIQLSLPLGIQAIIGFALGAMMVTSVYLLIFFVVLGVLAVGLLQINQMKIIEKIQQKIFVRFTFEFAEKIPKFDLKKIDNYYLPEKINRFFDTLNVQKGFSKLLLDIPIATIQIIFGLILLSLYHPFFIVFTLLLVLILWMIFYFTSTRGLETSIKESDHKYIVAAWLEELGRVIKSFKYTQGTNLNLRKTDDKLIKYVKSRTSHFNILLLQFKSLVFFKVSITALMLILGTYLLFDQKLNIGEFVAAEIVILTIINSLEKLISSLENVYDVITGLYKIDSILDSSLENEGAIKMESKSLQIEINELTFSYNDDKNIFTGLNLIIPANSISCITGNENSGKTTFLKLMTGSYSDFGGSIFFNNIPIQNYELASLRSKTGVYLNDQALFQGSLYENITLGREDISIENIMDLAKKIGISNFILHFEKSFKTQIQPVGMKLPSSLVKKILLLRAFISNPVLLILQDPWHGLDDSTMLSIKNYIMEVSQSTTILLLTTDEEFIQKCDQQFHINQGRITKIK